MNSNNEWVSVKFQLPKLDVNVEVYNEDTKREWVTRRTIDRDVITTNDDFAGLPLPYNNVTHWRYINKEKKE